MTFSFRDYFSTLYDGREPFPWQERLAENVVRDGWPRVIDLPTASGKTSCVDIAIFAMIATTNAPRRVFFVVDRRIIVDGTFRRYKECARKLAAAKDGILFEAANKLRRLGDSETPLDVHQLRGGIYRDQSWVRSPLQPMVITSTVDQVGSRLLFRGYGVSPSAWPIHAGLVANDALIFLDEAHCSRAFAQTLRLVEKYRSEEWAEESLGRPFRVVEMTATPAQEGDSSVFGLEGKDRAHSVLSKRLHTSKQITLHTVSAKPSDAESVAKALVERSLDLAKDGSRKRHAIIANRIGTAKATAKKLKDHLAKQKDWEAGVVSLMIGRMRPIDRDDQLAELDVFSADTRRDSNAQRSYLVATQCVEVGADLDFDSLVTECASVDSLVQRFGRLDRLGELDGNASGCIVLPEKTLGAKTPDPIYGRALEETWNWLCEHRNESGALDFGIESGFQTKRTIPEELRALGIGDADKLRRVGANAPCLLPSHIDALCQTSPTPHTEPEVSLFLHGAEAGQADVQVVWRADLVEEDAENAADWKWIATIATCPPSSVEAMPVRLSVLREWFDVLDSCDKLPLDENQDADLEGVVELSAARSRFSETEAGRRVVLWRGKDSEVLDVPSKAGSIRPGDTVILPTSYRGWDSFGHIPASGLVANSDDPIDFGDRAALSVRKRPMLRLHPKVLAQWPECQTSGVRAKLERLAMDPDLADLEEIRNAIREYRESMKLPEWLCELLDAVTESKQLQLLKHPMGVGTILMARARSREILEDAGDDSSSMECLIPLDKHLQDVRLRTVRTVREIAPQYETVLAQAAALHDTGKVDSRFQTLLHCGDSLAAALSPVPLAKGERLNGADFLVAWKRSRLPKRFRHELLSLHFAERVSLDFSETEKLLMLHLIASHHGRCRPFAPVVIDERPPDLQWGGVTVSSVELTAEAAHRLDSGIARRFWQLTRRFGWWGLPYLEAVFRISDWVASAAESEQLDGDQEAKACVEG